LKKKLQEVRGGDKAVEEERKSGFDQAILHGGKKKPKNLLKSKICEQEAPPRRVDLGKGREKRRRKPRS